MVVVKWSQNRILLWWTEFVSRTLQ